MKFETIVAPTDLEANSDPGVREAADIVRRYGRRLVLLAVASGSDIEVEPASHEVHHARADLERQLQERLEEVAGEIGEGIEVEIHVRFGEAVSELLSTVRETGADAVVITVKNRSRLGKLLMGSKAQEILLRSTVPVICIPRP